MRTSCDMGGVIQDNECYSVSSDVAKHIFCDETKVPEGVMVNCSCCFDPEDIVTKHWCNLTVHATRAADTVMIAAAAAAAADSSFVHTLFLPIICSIIMP